MIHMHLIVPNFLTKRQFIKLWDGIRPGLRALYLAGRSPSFERRWVSALLVALTCDEERDGNPGWGMAPQLGRSPSGSQGPVRGPTAGSFTVLSPQNDKVCSS